MVKELPQIEDSSITNYIKPKGIYTLFTTAEDFLSFTRKWGLNSSTSEKEVFWYKESYYKRSVEIIGYEDYKNGYQTAIIRFLDGNLGCINPMYLKDMQNGSFGEEHDDDSLNEQLKKAKMPRVSSTLEDTNASSDAIALPTGKVTFTGTLERFDEVYNAYTEKVDAIILWRDVELAEGSVKLAYAWCGYSKTLEKLEMVEGTRVSCLVEAVAKDFNDVAKVKVNRPSKIEILT